jgi:putrescine transport system ATP-binding protein
MTTGATGTRPWLDPKSEPFIKIENITKRFGDFTAVDNVSLGIYRSELFALLGGSGCGKTTLLRMLAGFEAPTAGRIVIDGQDMTGIPPYERPVNMMFQSYALFPHMTVEKNVGYGLKHEKLTDAGRKGRVREMLDLVQLTPLALRKPHQLSGGQRQRVALARALAKQPKLLLLDEPLGALDRKLREHTQFEIMNIQDKTGITFIVVTHDQEEAMTLASRIAVMDRGIIRQTGTPTEVYEFPQSRFVADFIGSTNQFEGVVTSVAGGRALVECPAWGTIAVDDPNGIASGASVAIAVRPEKIAIARERPDTCPNAAQGKVVDLGYFGKDSLYRVKLASGELIRVNRVNERRAGETERVAVWEDEVWLTFDPTSAILLSG